MGKQCLILYLLCSCIEQRNRNQRKISGANENTPPTRKISASNENNPPKQRKSKVRLPYDDKFCCDDDNFHLIEKNSRKGKVTLVLPKFLESKIISFICLKCQL